MVMSLSPYAKPNVSDKFHFALSLEANALTVWVMKRSL